MNLNFKIIFKWKIKNIKSKDSSFTLAGLLLPNPLDLVKRRHRSVQLAIALQKRYNNSDPHKRQANTANRTPPS